MIEIKIRDNSKEAFEKGIKTFKSVCKKDGFIREINLRRYFRKPSEIKRQKRTQRKRSHA